MKQSTRQELSEFLQSHYLNDDYVIPNLFYQFYAEREFSSIDELLNGIDEFFDFLANNIHLFKYNPDTIIKSRLPKIIESARDNIKLNFSGSMFDDQEKFSNNIETLVGTSNLGSILDVGAGHVAASSLFLAKKAKRVTAMDSYFYLSQQAMKNMNVIPLQQFMSETTDVSDYDIVVGRAPCSGIVSIVTACKKANKPYIILLCDCKLPPKLKTDSDSLGWENVLPKIDPNIRFHGQYAFNFDATPDQIKKLIIDYKPKPLKDRVKGFWSRNIEEFDPDFPEFQ